MTDRYTHTQRGRIHLVLVGVTLLLVAIAIPRANVEPGLTGACFAIGALFLALASSFAHLTIEEREHDVRAVYGPLRVFSRRVPFTEILSARPARSALVDGFGIHWVPGRGWTMNLWGRSCVELELTRGRTLRLGTDEAERLAEVIRARISPAAAG
ncbi:MAG: hypothetical protein AAF957_23950 [Planctomycetota bacterium]